MQDKVVLVTGGAAGIGKATALRFSEEGARVVICDLNEAAGQETRSQLGDEALFFKVNVADRAEAQGWIDQVVENMAVSMCWSITQVSCAMGSLSSSRKDN
jgi:3-oxoacyl-[acyl-carrier protein] reductase